MRLILLLFVALAAAAQTSTDAARFREAGVCSRCHVAQVLEWSTSAHPQARVACQNCHGPSTAHVANERNEVKPDRRPRGAEIAGLCQSCHTQGCPKTSRRDACESCHHVHALFNPTQNKELQSMRFAEDDRLKAFDAHMHAGEQFITNRDWQQAGREFEAALRIYPSHRGAKARLNLTKRRLNPNLPGFEIVGDRFDSETGLPLQVRVAGLPIEMVLIPAGDADIGDDKMSTSSPVHTVSLPSFYIARTELTQQAWLIIERENPSTNRGENLPVHNVSWKDAQHWIAQLNSRVSAGGFRLPTEVEWEFAARSESTQRNLSAIGWFRDNSATASGVADFKQIDAYTPHPVGTKQADSRGLHDLLGNVWEWCSTLMKPYPYNADDGRESMDAPGLRVLRGGSFADSADYLQPSFRHGERPDRRVVFNGVRLVRTVPAP